MDNRLLGSRAVGQVEITKSKFPSRLIKAHAKINYEYLVTPVEIRAAARIIFVKWSTGNLRFGKGLNVITMKNRHPLSLIIETD